MVIAYNFEFTKTPSDESLLQNRAFLYGDGLFETMIYYEGKLKFADDHVLRLTEGMQALSMQVPGSLTVPYLEKNIPELIRHNGWEGNARVKIQVCRRAGGLYTPSSDEADFYLMVFPLHAFSASPGIKEKVFFYRDVRLSASKISLYKTCSALPYVMAGIARKEAGADDMVLLDVYGHIAECTASNIFWMKEGRLYTPSLNSGCIAGVMRKQILLRAAKLQMPVVEGLFTEYDLLHADVIFCSNVAGIQLIRQVEAIQFDPETVPAELITSY